MEHLPGRVSSALLTVLIMMGSSMPIAAAAPDPDVPTGAGACFLDLDSSRTLGDGCGTVDIGAGAAPLGPHERVPPVKPSFYITVQDTEWAYEVGCEMGHDDELLAGTQTAVVVLAFGQTEKTKDGDFRLSYFHGPDRPFSHARDMVVAMGRGYDACTGTDTTSRLWIGLGTNNYPDSTVSRGAGAALARAARDASEQLAGSPQAAAWGANDFEAWGDSPRGLNKRSRNWLKGYNAVPGRPPMVNFGSADGCPISEVPDPDSCHHGLTADTIVYLSTTGAARALPEIYTPTGSQAGQWRQLALYARAQGTPMRFAGVMAQEGACGQRGGCEGIDNSPKTAWLQLNRAIDEDRRTAGTPGAPTDIFWQENLLEDD